MMELLPRELDPEKTKAAFKSVARFYDIWSWLTERKAAQRVIEFAGVNDGEAVLEVACGTGVVFEQLVQRNPNGTTVGIDFSPEMLERAKRRLQKSPYSHYELKPGDALHLEFDDGAFDLVVNNFMVDLMPYDTFNPIAQEFYRVLKPGGSVVVSTFSFGETRVHRLWFWVAKLFPDLLTGCRPVAFKTHLEKAGFEIETALQISQNTFPTEVIKARKIVA